MSPSVAALLLSMLSICAGYQIDIEKQKIYRDVVQKSLISKEVQPLLEIRDDSTYSTHISCPKSGLQEGKVPVARPLSDIFESMRDIPPSRSARPRKIMGIDEDPAEYWFDNRIHTFGNTGFYGALHAACAPFATKIIDDSAYRGFDVRTLVAQELHKYVGKDKTRVLDLCCGVGMSTRALQSAFHDAEAVIGLDTSPEMLAMGKFITDHETDMKKSVKALVDATHTLMPKKKPQLLSKLSKRLFTQSPFYVRGNAERTIFKPKAFDLVTIMYGFHEIPRIARYRILREARRVLMSGGTLAIIDISPEYTPSKTMLAGEPYVLEYKKNIHKQLKLTRGFTNFQHFDIVPGHVNMWLLTRLDKAVARKGLFSV